MRLFTTVAAMLVASLAGAANAQAVNEVGDAGETLATAQLITGGVTSISGSLVNLGGAGANIDDIDLYRFSVSDPNAFGVTVDSNLSVDNDAQLFLFDSLGQFVAADDDGGDDQKPQFNVGVLAGRAAGDYYLAYDLFNSDPVFTAGVLTGFNRRPAPFQTGTYTLNITGAAGIAQGVPEPATWALMIAGFGLAGASMRRRLVSDNVRLA